jgi:hypothetical protein
MMFENTTYFIHFLPSLEGQLDILTRDFGLVVLATPLMSLTCQAFRKKKKKSNCDSQQFVFSMNFYTKEPH